jgi:hypothetical protein
MAKSDRCANCGGRFGLVCHYHWGLRFCRRACKTSFRENSQGPCAHGTMVRLVDARHHAVEAGRSDSSAGHIPSQLGPVQAVLLFRNSMTPARLPVIKGSTTVATIMSQRVEDN